MNSRKFLIVGIIFLGIVIIGLASYNLFFARTAPPALDVDTVSVSTEVTPQASDVASPSSPANPVSTAEISKLQAISSGPVVGLTLSRSGTSAVYYNRTNGHLVESTLDGATQTELSDTDVSGLVEVLWSPKKDATLTARVEKDGRLVRAYFNLNTRNVISLSENIKYVAWSPDGSKIVYFYRDFVNSSSIAIADPDGTDWVAIQNAQTLPQKIDWPLGTTIYYATPQTRTTGSFYDSVSLQDINSSRTWIRDAFNLETQWAPDGTQYLYSETDPNGQIRTLHRVQVDRGSKQKIDLGARASKCAWSESGMRVYCAVEASALLDVGILPPEYASTVFPTTDTIWSIDFTTLEVSDVLIPQDQRVINVQEMQVSSNEDYLIFVNTNDLKAYSLKI